MGSEKMSEKIELTSSWLALDEKPLEQQKEETIPTFFSRSTQFHSLMGETKIDFFFRDMTIDEFRMIMEWCAQEGWNVGRRDTDIYFSATTRKHVSLVKVDPKNGQEEVIGGLGVVFHGGSFTGAGPMIVKKEFRNMGLGQLLWKLAVDTISDNPLLMYAVAQQVPRYSEDGFIPIFKMERWVGRLSSISLDQEDCEPITLDNLEKVAKYDQEIFSQLRFDLFKKALEFSDIQGFVVIEDTIIRGFCIIRPCQKGYRIGPVHADNINIAKKLIKECSKISRDEQVVLDMPSINALSEDVARFFSLEHDPDSDTIAMKKGKLPVKLARNWNKVFSVFSLEIG